jgi:hypothetical protein
MYGRILKIGLLSVIGVFPAPQAKRAPAKVTSFAVSSCTPVPDGPKYFNQWTFTWQTLGSTGGATLEIRATDSGTDDPSTGFLVDSLTDVPGGPDAQTKYTSVIYGIESLTPTYKYLWARYINTSFAWIPLDENALNIATTACAAF